MFTGDEKKRASKLYKFQRNKRIINSTHCVRRKLSVALMEILNRSGGAFLFLILKVKIQFILEQATKAQKESRV